MHKMAPLITCLSCLIASSMIAEDSTSSADKPEAIETKAAVSTVEAKSEPKAGSNKPFDAFTGKIVKNKVRIRLQPAFDSQVLRELNRDDLIIVLSENEDFYAIQPPAGTKAYIFRTYVLDNVVEGSRVNVRLKPDLDAPVVAQLSSGDRVSGQVYATNNKWLEIALPESARFYIAKEYVEKIGDAGLLDRLSKRREEVNRLLNTTKSIAETELQKPFDQMRIDGITANYQRVILDYKDFPESVTQAQALLKTLQETYTAKKIAYLESQAKQSSVALEEKNKKLNAELQAHKAKVSQLELQLRKDRAIAAAESAPATVATRKPTQLPFNMAAWIPVENALFAEWSQQTGGSDPADFYQEQKLKSFAVKGIIDNYNRPVKNKPGDYMLISSTSKLPLAFLYSTLVNLQDYVGHEVTIWVAPRPNNNYAFPAYFVFSIE